MSVPEALSSTASEANTPPSDYWLEQSEGFQVSGPNGRIGFVALVLSSDEGVDGLLVRTGLFRARSVFVPVHEVGSVIPRRQRLELLITPRVPRARISDIVRELFAPAADLSPLHAMEAAEMTTEKSRSPRPAWRQPRKQPALAAVRDRRQRQ
jgi:hypothetical protein